MIPTTLWYLGDRVDTRQHVGPELLRIVRARHERRHADDRDIESPR
jgi:hypothetical protein